MYKDWAAGIIGFYNSKQPLILRMDIPILHGAAAQNKLKVFFKKQNNNKKIKNSFASQTQCVII